MFPDDDVEITVEAAFGADATTDPSTWTFTDLSSRLIKEPITINRGVLVGQGSRRSASATVRLQNLDGALTPLLATSPYYPYVDAGTPVRVSARSNTTPYVQDTFARTVAAGGWGTADNGFVWASTNSAYSVNSGTGRIAIPTANTAIRMLGTYANTDTDCLFDLSIAAITSGNSILCGPVLRVTASLSDYLWAGIEFGTDSTINFSVYNSVALLAHVPAAGLTYTAGAVIRCRVRLIGTTLVGRAWTAGGTEPTSWPLQLTVATPTIPGVYLGIQTWVQAGNTNTLPNTISVDSLTFQQPKVPRIEGYITDVRPTFQPIASGNLYSAVQIDIGGIGTRLENKAADQLSPLRRSLQKANISPIAYWSLEDADASLTASSAVYGGLPMVPSGPVVFSFDTGLTGDALLSTFGSTAMCSVAAGASLVGPVPVSNTGGWTVSCQQQQYTPGVGGAVTEVRILEWRIQDGTFNRWALIRNLSGYFIARAYNDTAGTTTDVATVSTNYGGSLLYVEVNAVQSGGSINSSIFINANQYATGSVAGTLGAVTQVAVNPDQTNVTGSVDPYGIKFLVSHIQVYAAAGSFLPFFYDTGLGGSVLIRADRGWGYEFAHHRVLRLCNEEDVPVTIIGTPYTTGVTQLNVQQAGTFTELITAAADAESGGILAESGFGYEYTPRSFRYTRAVDLTVDMSTYRRMDNTDPATILVPSLNSRGPNYWTVQRTNGSASTAGASAAYRARRGTISDKATLDVLLDSDTPHHAGWRTHLYADGAQANYPGLILDLAANPNLIDNYLHVGVGARVQRLNQPTLAGAGTIDQMVDQLSETITPRVAGSGPGWTATLDTSPASVWQVGVFDAQYWDSASTTLGAAVTSAGTVLLFSTARKGDAWSVTTSPITVTIFGQTTTVLWMSGIGSVAQIESGFETSAGFSGWQATTANISQSTAYAHTGSYSAYLAVVGTPAAGSMYPATQWPVTANASYTATAWVYATSSVANVRISISWYTSAATFVSSVVASTITLNAGVWTLLTVSGVAPGTAGLARPIPTIISPPAGTTMYVDDVDLTLDSASTGFGPYVQTAYVTRDPVVVNTLPAGAEIHVSDPLWWSL